MKYQTIPFIFLMALSMHFGVGLNAQTQVAKDTISNSIACSLKGKQLLVTAPENYAIRLAMLITRKGGKAIATPVIRTIVNPDSRAIEKVLLHPSGYPWIMMSSRKAIDAFFARAADKQYISSLPLFKICAIGKDAEYMKSRYHSEASLVPQEASPAGIVKGLALLPEAKGQTIAVIAPKVVGLREPDVVPNFITDLKAIGMNPEKIDGYITSPESAANYKTELEMLRNGQIDLVVFTSATEAEALLAIVGDVKLLNKQRIACFGPYTATNVKKLGIKVDYVGKDYHSFDAFVEEICDLLK